MAHVLLAVQDSATACQQPIASPSGRYVACFNGEIYNHWQLRDQLGSGHAWKGRSDTETLAAALDYWGIEECLRRVDGMFAVAVWDQFERRLHLARDRMGEKPLYYGWQSGVFVFASELKALELHPAFAAKVRQQALSYFLRHGYIPAPESIWEGISKLLPAHIATVDAGPLRTPDVRPYWRLPLAGGSRSAAAANVAAIEEDLALADLEDCISSAVDGATLAAVPIGVLLSGGIDSSLVVALLRSRHPGREIPTFSMGFQERDLDEAPLARRTAEFLRTKHHEVYLKSSDVLRISERLSTVYDEPFADSSQIPTVLLCEHARQYVTVVLTGDGGDELFLGYPRYPHVARRLRQSARVKAVGAAFSWLPALDGPARALGLSAWLKSTALLRSCDRIEAYSAARSHAHALLLAPWRMPTTASMHYLSEIGNMSLVEAVAAIDLLEYLPDDLLVKVDRASMSASLETRAPLLSRSVVEMAMRLPTTLKIRGGSQKHALRAILARHLPGELICGRKRGFAPPIAGWLRKELREWADTALASCSLEQTFGIERRVVNRLWRSHCEDRSDHSAVLWSLVMLSSWYDGSRRRRSAPAP